MVEPNDNESTIESVDVAAIRRHLAATDVRFALLFGSRVRGNTHELSDVDIALRFPGDLSPAERFRRRNRIDADLQGYADGFVDVSDIDGLPLPIARAALEHGIRLVGDGGEIDAYHEPIDAAYEEITTTRERGHRSPISRLATGAIQLVDEAVVTTKLRQAHEYTSDLTEMRGISEAEYVSEIVRYSHSTDFVEILNS